MPVRMERLFDIRKAGANTSDSTGVINSTALQQALTQADQENMDGVYIPAGEFTFYGSVRVPSNVSVNGAGQGRTVLKVHPDFASNGPLFAHSLDAAGHPAVTENVTLRDFSIDGNYRNNAARLTVCTTTEDFNYVSESDRTLVVDDTTGFPDAGRVLFETYDVANDNVGTLTYTSKDATHFYGCEWQEKANSYPVDVPSGTNYRLFSTTTTSMLRFHAYNRLVLERVHVYDTGSYCFSGGGYRFETDDRTKTNLTMIDVTLGDETLGGSYNADGMDIKDNRGMLLLRVRAVKNYDKGINPRGSQTTLVGCETTGNGGGYIFQTGYSDDYHDVLYRDLPSSITSAVNQTVSLSSATGWPASGYAWIGGCERVHFTRSRTTLTLDQRGLSGTQAAAHSASTGSAVVKLVPEVDGTDEVDGSVWMFGCTSRDDLSISVALMGAGQGKMRCGVFGGEFVGGTAGIKFAAGYGVTEASIEGAFIHGASGVGIAISNTKSFSIGPGVRVTGCGDDAIDILHCTNGGRISNPLLADNTGYGVLSRGDTDFVHYDGRPGMSNTLGPVSLVGTRNTGSALGVSQRGFVPLKAIEGQPLALCEATTNVTASTALLTCFTALGPINAHRLFTYVTTTKTAQTTAKMALATVSGTTATIVAVTANFGGGIWNNSGHVQPQLAADYWLETGRRYAVVQLQVGAATPPAVAAHTAAQLDTTATWRLPEGGTSSASDLAVGDTLTITPTATVAYAGVMAGS